MLRIKNNSLKILFLYISKKNNLKTNYRTFNLPKNREGKW